jgi:integrase
MKHSLDSKTLDPWKTSLPSPEIELPINFNNKTGANTLHTFRHWKATMKYHKNKDNLHVMNLLGHRIIEFTLVYA